MNEPTVIGILVLAGTQIMQFGLLWRKMSGVAEKREITPQPLVVQAATEHAPRDHTHAHYQTISDCKAMHTCEKDNATRSEMQLSGRIEQLRLEIKSDIKGLHARTDDVLREVSALSGRIDEMGKRI